MTVALHWVMLLMNFKFNVQVVICANGQEAGIFSTWLQRNEMFVLQDIIQKMEAKQLKRDVKALMWVDDETSDTAEKCSLKC